MLQLTVNNVDDAIMSANDAVADEGNDSDDEDDYDDGGHVEAVY